LISKNQYTFLEVILKILISVSQHIKALLLRLFLLCSTETNHKPVEMNSHELNSLGIEVHERDLWLATFA